MDKIRYKPVRHDHDAFLKKARKRRGFQAAYKAMEIEYAVAGEMLAARTTRAGLTQEAVASRMGLQKARSRVSNPQASMRRHWRP